MVSCDQEKLEQVDVDAVSVNRFQPRCQFDEGELLGLAASIRAVGLIQPPVVRKVEGCRGYELIAGERRLRAAKMAGMKTIPVFVRHACCDASAQVALVENIQRVDLNPMEIAWALKDLADRGGLSQEQLSKRVGKKRSTVANYLRLLSLPSAIGDSVSQGTISMGHAKVILSMEGESRQLVLHARIVAEGLAVRQTERVAESLVRQGDKGAIGLGHSDEHVKDLEDRLQRALNTKVTIQGRGSKGKVVIDYYSFDDLDRILEVLQVEEV